MNDALHTIAGLPSVPGASRMPLDEALNAVSKLPHMPGMMSPQPQSQVEAQSQPILQPEFEGQFSFESQSQLQYQDQRVDGTQPDVQFETQSRFQSSSSEGTSLEKLLSFLSSVSPSHNEDDGKLSSEGRDGEGLDDGLSQIGRDGDSTYLDGASDVSMANRGFFGRTSKKSSHSEREVPYLKYMRIDSFGAFAQKTIGPFYRGMNVVFGGNESGKSTLLAFAEGVLFGWPEARGSRNTYKSDTAERAGSLIFACGDKPDVELRRTRNAAGLQGKKHLVADIDKDTFKTMFALTSDELRCLGNTEKLTSELLTAGSGTHCSPTAVLCNLEQRLATYTSRAREHEHSFIHLQEARDAARTRVQQAEREVERIREHHRELHNLDAKLSELTIRTEALNRTLETYHTGHQVLERLQTESRTVQEELQPLRDEHQHIALETEQRASADTNKCSLSENDTAQPNKVGSARFVVSGISLALVGLLCVAFGLIEQFIPTLLMPYISKVAPTFIGASLATGIFLILAACGIAIIGVCAARNPYSALGRSRVSRQHAHTLQTLREQDISLTTRIQILEGRLAEIDQAKHDMCARMQLDSPITLEEIDMLVKNAERERIALSETIDALNQRKGTLSQELSTALTSDDFNREKLHYQTIGTRIEDAKREFARLVVACELLQRAIETWQSDSQPQVYALASELLALMTAGHWVRVQFEGDELQVVDAAHAQRTPNQLSLGTTQQLYLALRIALLICAAQVGRSIPVFADDILVHFDAPRRKAAAQALAELARTRQVIVCTSHAEVLEVLREASDGINVIRL